MEIKKIYTAKYCSDVLNSVIKYDFPDYHFFDFLSLYHFFDIIVISPPFSIKFSLSANNYIPTDMHILTAFPWKYDVLPNSIQAKLQPFSDFDTVSTGIRLWLEYGAALPVE